MSWRLLLPERSCGLLGLIKLPGGRPTSDGALTPGVVVVERSRTTTPERRGPILTAPTRQPRLQPWPCLCRCEYLRQCTASVRSSASAACRIPAGALMVIELAGDVVRKITRPTLAVIVSKSGRMSSSRNHPLLQRQSPASCSAYASRGNLFWFCMWCTVYDELTCLTGAKREPAGWHEQRRPVQPSNISAPRRTEGSQIMDARMCLSRARCDDRRPPIAQGHWGWTAIGA
jgi:hypothetical protein